MADKTSRIEIMTDNTTAVPAQDVPNLQKDEVTGEMVSKSEMKKRQKKREADERKVCPPACDVCRVWIDADFCAQAKKAAAAPARAAKPKVDDKAADEASQKLNEEELTPNVCPTPLLRRSSCSC